MSYICLKSSVSPSHMLTIIVLVGKQKGRCQLNSYEILVMDVNGLYK